MTPAVVWLILANVSFYVVSASQPGFREALVLVPALLPVRPWTAVSYLFLHGSFGHILFNMLALFFFGPRIEARLGTARFLQLYFISGITGALCSLVTPWVPIVGASGAVFGVQLAFAMFYPRDQILIYGIIPVEARTLVIVTTALSLWQGMSGTGRGIAHFAHLGGYLGAWVYLTALRRRGPAFATARGGGMSGLRERVLEQAAARGAEMERRLAAIDGARLHEVNRTELERIRAKVAAAGIGSLSAGEREFVERFSAA